ncbi:MAG: glutamine amidotransferase [Elusimicrobiota bacterium]
MSLNIANVNILYWFILAAAVASLAVKPAKRLLFLRIAGYSILFFIMLRPVIKTGRTITETPAINIYIDSSKSMSVQNRYEQAVNAAKELYEELSGRAHLNFFTFSKEALKTDLNSAASSSPQGERTNLSSILETDSPQARVLITDGQHNYGVNPLGKRELSVLPLFALAVGSSFELPDLALNLPEIPPVAYRGQEISINFNLGNAAKSSGNVSVYIKKGQSLIASKSLDLAKRKQIEGELTFTPAEAGIKEYSIEVDPIEGEINTANNKRVFHLNVKRDTLRVLYVTGQPSWEYSFLRRFLKSDPHIELVSFLILRNPQNVTIVPENELSLIHFPAREMFTDKIYDFDLLFYDNFSYERFFPSSYLDHIKNFVSKGGGFIMMGGENSFGRGGYSGTPIADILPVEIDAASPWIREKISPDVTGPLSHPVLNIAGEEEISRRIWNEIPDMEGYDKSLTAKTDATVLMSSNEGIPLIVSGAYGEGRVMAFNSNSTWRWAMGLSARGKTSYYYNRFWQNAVRYAIQSPEAEPLRIFPQKKSVAAGSTVRTRIKVLDSNYNPVEGAKVDISLSAPDQDEKPLPSARDSSPQGWYEIDIPVKNEGTHLIKARASKNDRYLGSGETSIEGIKINREMSQLSVNRELLYQMTARAGGEVFNPGEIDSQKIISALEGYTKEKGEEKIKWDWAPVLLLIVLIIAIEWLLGD